MSVVAVATLVTPSAEILANSTEVRSAAAFQIYSQRTKTTTATSSSTSVTSPATVNGSLELISADANSTNAGRLRSSVSGSAQSKEKSFSLSGELAREVEYETLSLASSLGAIATEILDPNTKLFPVRLSYRNSETDSGKSLTASLSAKKSFAENTELSALVTGTKEIDPPGNSSTVLSGVRLNHRWSANHASDGDLSLVMNQTDTERLGTFSPSLNHTLSLAEVGAVTASGGVVYFYGSALDGKTFFTYGLTASREDKRVAVFASFKRSASPRTQGQKEQYLAETASFSVGLALHPRVSLDTEVIYRREVGSPFRGADGELLNGWIVDQSIKFALARNVQAAAQQASGALVGIGIFFGLAEQLSLRNETYGARAFISTSI